MTIEYMKNNSTKAPSDGATGPWFEDNATESSSLDNFKQTMLELTADMLPEEGIFIHK